MPHMNSTGSFYIIMNIVSLLSFQFWNGISDACQRSWWLVPMGKFGSLEFYPEQYSHGKILAEGWELTTALLQFPERTI